MTTPEPLSDEQLAWLRHMLGGTSPLDLLVVRLLDEHARLKARDIAARESLRQCQAVADGIERMRLLPGTCAALVLKIRDTTLSALNGTWPSPDASTTEAKPCTR